MPKTRDVNSPTDEERLIEAVETALKGRPQPGDVGHMLHEDEPLIVVRLGDLGSLVVMDEDGTQWTTYLTCFVTGGPDLRKLDAEVVARLHRRVLLLP